MADFSEYTLTLKEVSVQMCMPQHIVLKCVGRVARKNGTLKLACIDHKGEPYFRQKDVDDYLADLALPWVDDANAPRPGIPDYFEESLRYEVGFKCGLCGQSYAADFAHIVEYKTCLHHHPWNILSLCTSCHKGYDREKRISSDEVRRAKERVQAMFRDDLKFAVADEKLLSRLQAISFPLNGTTITGIDYLLSAIVPGGEYLEISKLRTVRLCWMLGNGELSSAEAVSMFRITELALSQLSAVRIGTPFWDEVADSLYVREFYPRTFIGLDVVGKRVVQSLFFEAEKYVDTSKYRDFKSLAAKDLVRKVTEYVQSEQDRRDRKDTMDDESLRDFVV